MTGRPSGSMRMLATKVRCVWARGSGKGWIFYDNGGSTAFLSNSKLNQQDYFLQKFLRQMGKNENRHFAAPSMITVVHGKKPDALLVHRVDNVADMIAWKEGKSRSVKQERLI